MSLFERCAILLSPKAVLHTEHDLGYIPMDPQTLDIHVNTQYAFVYDCSRDRIIYLKGEDQVVYPASITKLLTILVALEVLSPNDTVLPGEELSLVDEDSSLADIRIGQALTVDQLIEGMLLPSGNDAAYALAAAAGHRISGGELSGKAAVKVFMQSMNEYARAHGLKGSHFTVPDGLAGEGHYTTLEDMVLVAKAAINNHIIRRYAALPQDSVTYADGYTTTWINTNAMLHPDSPYYRASVIGLKTGSLDHNCCVVIGAKIRGTHYLIGIFGAEDNDTRFADAAAIVDLLTNRREVAK